MKRGFALFLCGLLALSGSSAFGLGGKPKSSYTLVVLPSNYTAVQFGHDLVEREKVLLISYQAASAPGAANLHAWTGARWVKVPDSRFQDGSFARVAPERTIVVGGNNDLTTSLITDASNWSPEVLNVESSEPAALVNAMGRFMDFSDRDWEWYAARYELRLEDLNAPQRSRSWYDQNSPATIDESAPPPVLNGQVVAEDTILISDDPAPADTVDSFSFDAN